MKSLEQFITMLASTQSKIYDFQMHIMITADSEDDLTDNTVLTGDMSVLADEYIKALGGSDNIVTVDNCVTRLRLGVKDNAIIKDKDLTRLGARGVMRPGKGNIQVVVGTNVQFVADALKKKLKK